MVHPEKILKELSNLWVDLGHEQQEDTHTEKGAGVLRACAMTLLTISDETDDPTNVGETVAMLMREHPSRSVLIRLRNEGGAFLDSRVFAQCWMPFGQRRQICCEQIEITASVKSLEDVPGVVLPLTVPDLPVILWCRSSRLLESDVFPRIAGIANKVIADSSAATDAGQALSLIANRAGQKLLFADLAWVRTTRWRETLSQLFVNRMCLEFLPGAKPARIEYGTEQPRTEALYLAAWLENGLRRAGSRVNVELARVEGPAIAALVLGEGGSSLSIRCDRNGAVEVHARGAETRTIFPEATDYLTLREELSITSRDPAFQAALPLALEMVNRA